MYSITVSNTVNLREICNLPEGVISINFVNRIIRVQDINSALNIAEIMEIEDFKTEIKKSSKFSSKLDIGSIARIRDKEGQCIHVVIIKINKDNYVAAKMDLGIENKGIILEKEKDVIYKNITYKTYTTILYKFYNNLVVDDFLDSHNPAVGKVINTKKLDQIIEKYSHELTLEEIINMVSSIEGLILQLTQGDLYLSNGMLEKSILLAKKMRTTDIRKITSAMKKEYNITQTQKEVQFRIDSEYNELVKKYPTKMNRSKFLKMLLKTF